MSSDGVFAVISAEISQAGLALLSPSAPVCSSGRSGENKADWKRLEQDRRRPAFEFVWNIKVLSASGAPSIRSPCIRMHLEQCLVFLCSLEPYVLHCVCLYNPVTYLCLSLEKKKNRKQKIEKKKTAPILPITCFPAHLISSVHTPHPSSLFQTPPPSSSPSTFTSLLSQKPRTRTKRRSPRKSNHA